MSDQKSCPNCGHTNRASARFCGKCGFDVTTTAAPAAGQPVATSPAQKPAAPSGPASAPPEFCPSCGREVAPGVRFCRYCGADLSAAAALPVQAPPPVAVAPVQAAASTPAKTTTRPDPMPVAPPAQPASSPARVASQPAPQPAQATDAPPAQPAPARKGVSPWLFLLIGAAIGLLLGAGGLWSFQNFVTPQGTDNVVATPAPATEEIAPTEAITGTVAPAESTPITGTAPAEVPPGEAPAPASEGDAPAVDASATLTESVSPDASGVQTGTTEP